MRLANILIRTNNERIDLAQFEGMTEGPWWFGYQSDLDIPFAEAVVHGSVLHRGVNSKDSRYKVVIPDFDGVLAPNAIAMASAPDLIAELKRCYEEMDNLKRQHSSCYESLINTTNWNIRLVEAIDSGKLSVIKRVRNS